MRWVFFCILAAAFLLVQVTLVRAVVVQTDKFGLQYGPLIGAFIIFAPSLFLLGTISPFAVRIHAKSLDHLGTTVGNLYAISTSGSLVGGLLAGFYFVPNFSVSFIINMLSLSLFFLFLVWQILILLKKK